MILIGATVAILAVSDNKDNLEVDQIVHVPIRSFAINLNPRSMADVESKKVATTLHAGLVAVDWDGTVRARVAESWSRDDVGLWRFEIKQGVTLSDGTPVTAETIIGSLCSNMQPGRSIWAWSLKSIEHKTTDEATECTGLSADGNRTVLIRESDPAPWFLEALAGPAGWIVPADAEGGEYGDIPGVGPYKIKEIVADSYVTVTARDTGAIPAHSDEIRFSYTADETAMAGAFKRGALDVLEIDSPVIRDILIHNGQLIGDGKLIQVPSDKTRIVIINLPNLVKKGFSESDADWFVEAYSRAVDRTRIGSLMEFIGEPITTAFPPYADNAGFLNRPDPIHDRPFPTVNLEVISQNDQFSNNLAGLLPSSVGGVSLTTRVVNKGALINALIEKEYDVASMLIESTVKAPVFWASFWRSDSPFVTFGRAIPEMDNLKFVYSGDVRAAAELIDRKGNWIGIARQFTNVAVSTSINGVRLTGSGQLSFEEIIPKDR